MKAGSRSSVGTIVATRKATYPAAHVLGYLVGFLVGCHATRHEPNGATASPRLAHRLAARAPFGCREKLYAQLIRGVRAGPCDPGRAPARVTLARQRLGVVRAREDALGRTQLHLSVAHACRSWPLPARGTPLRERDARIAGCLLRPYRGRLTLTAVQGEKRTKLGHAYADRNGHVTISLVGLRRTSADAQLCRYDTVELGAGGWAGELDLQAVRAAIRDRHQLWRAQGLDPTSLLTEVPRSCSSTRRQAT